VKHVVLISYYFAPDKAVGAVRPTRLAESLAAEGYDVDVVTACGVNEQPGIRTRDGRVTVHALRLPRSLRETILSLRRRGRKPPMVSEDTWRPGPQAEVAHTAAEPWRSRIRRSLLSLLWVPDMQQQFIVPAARYARRLLGPQTVVYTTSPVFSAAVAGRLAILGRSNTFIMELRDPWTTGDAKPAYITSGLSDALERRMERSCARRARAVVLVTMRARDAFASAHPTVRTLLAYNGFIPYPTRDRDPGDTLDILHAGNVYIGRDPRPLWRTLSRLRAAGDHHALRSRVRLLGTVPTLHGESLQAMAEQAGVGSLTTIEPAVSEAAARDLAANAGLLLLLAQRQPRQVPNKLFDYLAANRPILAYCDEDGETADILRRVGGHFLVTEHTTNESEIVASALASADAASAASSGALDAYRWSKQFEGIRALIEEA
jgi:hypothetical protein